MEAAAEGGWGAGAGGEGNETDGEDEQSSRHTVLTMTATDASPPMELLGCTSCLRLATMPLASPTRMLRRKRSELLTRTGAAQIQVRGGDNLNVRMELWKARSAVTLELELRCSKTAATLAAAAVRCGCTASPFLLTMLPTQSQACLSMSMLLPMHMKGVTLDTTAQDVSSSMSDRSYMMQASTRMLSMHSAATGAKPPRSHKRRQKWTRLVVSGRGMWLSSYKKFPTSIRALQVMAAGGGGLDRISERRTWGV